MAYPTVIAALCGALLIAAALSDALYRRIPNALGLAVLAAGLASQGVAHGGAGVGAGLAAAVITGALLWVPWQLRMMGGGDLKLAAAAAAWVGTEGLPRFLLATALVGGVLSISVALKGARGTSLAPSTSPLAAALASRFATARRGLTVPYGVAIAAGAAYAVLSGGAS
ncbi:A24 family peptidase [Anaeromyxobacter oryzae]|uniref:Prepilin type IV endopeptidase peptidase domain-containing protein n=1 Tax=Anaeromyxobacter oryzae TaxID=2918170 RepID=A0ABM7WP06_9BACT|nr:A24 family peptidase [Anaeromyxobacter oryzae]BDG01203.1 hypothetical protein AMOR_01990 [Anaeromyxobacter oryzae]